MLTATPPESTPPDVTLRCGPAVHAKPDVRTLPAAGQDEALHQPLLQFLHQPGALKFQEKNLRRHD